MKPRPAVARTLTGQEFWCSVLECRDGEVRIRYPSVLNTLEEVWIPAKQIVRYRDVCQRHSTHDIGERQ